MNNQEQMSKLPVVYKTTIQGKEYVAKPDSNNSNYSTTKMLLQYRELETNQE